MQIQQKMGTGEKARKIEILKAKNVWLWLAVWLSLMGGLAKNKLFAAGNVY